MYIHIYIYTVTYVYNMYTSSANLEIGMVPQIRKLLSFFVFFGGASFNGLHFGYFGSSRVLLSICFSGKLTWLAGKSLNFNEMYSSWWFWNPSQVGVKTTNIWNHHQVYIFKLLFFRGCIILEPWKLLEHSPFKLRCLIPLLKIHLTPP